MTDFDGWEDTDHRAHRSVLNDRVWVASVPDTDQTCFLRAGALRAVKAYLLEEYQLRHGEAITMWAYDLASDTHTLYVRNG